MPLELEERAKIMNSIHATLLCQLIIVGPTLHMLVTLTNYQIKILCVDDLLIPQISVVE